VPAGSTIKVIGHYDNSASNRSNPAPEQAVNWGEQSSDEMFNGFVDLSIDRFDVRHGTGRGTASATGAVPPGPKVPLVLVTGCAARDDEGRWILSNASAPAVSTVVHADADERLAMGAFPLQGRRYRLIGIADFGSVDEFLTAGQRAQFTDRQGANATGQLRSGRKIGVKGLLIDGSPDARLNVVSVRSLAETCP
jgi:hypothetical protein